MITLQDIEAEAKRLMGHELADRVRVEFTADPAGDTKLDIYDPTSNKGLTVCISAEDFELSLDDYSSHVLRRGISLMARTIREAA